MPPKKRPASPKGSPGKKQGARTRSASTGPASPKDKRSTVNPLPYLQPKKSTAAPLPPAPQSTDEEKKTRARTRSVSAERVPLGRPKEGTGEWFEKYKQDLDAGKYSTAIRQYLKSADEADEKIKNNQDLRCQVLFVGKNLKTASTGFADRGKAYAEAPGSGVIRLAPALAEYWNETWYAQETVFVIFPPSCTADTFSKWLDKSLSSRLKPDSNIGFLRLPSTRYGSQPDPVIGAYSRVSKLTSKTGTTNHRVYRLFGSQRDIEKEVINNYRSFYLECFKAIRRRIDPQEEEKVDVVNDVDDVDDADAVDDIELDTRTRGRTGLFSPAKKSKADDALAYVAAYLRLALEHAADASTLGNSAVNQQLYLLQIFEHVLQDKNIVHIVLYKAQWRFKLLVAHTTEKRTRVDVLPLIKVSPSKSPRSQPSAPALGRPEYEGERPVGDDDDDDDSFSRVPAIDEDDDDAETSRIVDRGGQSSTPERDPSPSIPRHTQPPGDDKKRGRRISSPSTVDLSSISKLAGTIEQIVTKQRTPSGGKGKRRAEEKSRPDDRVDLSIDEALEEVNRIEHAIVTSGLPPALTTPVRVEVGKMEEFIRQTDADAKKDSDVKARIDKRKLDEINDMFHSIRAAHSADDRESVSVTGDEGGDIGSVHAGSEAAGQRLVGDDSSSDTSETVDDDPDIRTPSSSVSRRKGQVESPVDLRQVGNLTGSVRRAIGHRRGDDQSVLDSPDIDDDDDDVDPVLEAKRKAGAVKIATELIRVKKDALDRLFGDQVIWDEHGPYTRERQHELSTALDAWSRLVLNPDADRREVTRLEVEYGRQLATFHQDVKEYEQEQAGKSIDEYAAKLDGIERDLEQEFTRVVNIGSGPQPSPKPFRVGSGLLTPARATLGEWRKLARGSSTPVQTRLVMARFGGQLKKVEEAAEHARSELRRLEEYRRTNTGIGSVDVPITGSGIDDGDDRTSVSTDPIGSATKDDDDERKKKQEEEEEEARLAADKAIQDAMKRKAEEDERKKAKEEEERLAAEKAAWDAKRKEEEEKKAQEREAKRVEAIDGQYAARTGDLAEMYRDVKWEQDSPIDRDKQSAVRDALDAWYRLVLAPDAEQSNVVAIERRYKDAVVAATANIKQYKDWTSQQAIDAERDEQIAVLVRLEDELDTELKNALSTIHRGGESDTFKAIGYKLKPALTDALRTAIDARHKEASGPSRRIQLDTLGSQINDLFQKIQIDANRVRALFKRQIALSRSPQRSPHISPSRSPQRSPHTSPRLPMALLPSSPPLPSRSGTTDTTQKPVVPVTVEDVKVRLDKEKDKINGQLVKLQTAFERWKTDVTGLSNSGDALAGLSTLEVTLTDADRPTLDTLGAWYPKAMAGESSGVEWDKYVAELTKLFARYKKVHASGREILANAFRKQEEDNLHEQKTAYDAEKKTLLDAFARLDPTEAESRLRRAIPLEASAQRADVSDALDKWTRAIQERGVLGAGDARASYDDACLSLQRRHSASIERFKEIITDMVRTRKDDTLQSHITLLINCYESAETKRNDKLIEAGGRFDGSRAGHNIPSITDGVGQLKQIFNDNRDKSLADLDKLLTAEVRRQQDGLEALLAQLDAWIRNQEEKWQSQEAERREEAEKRKQEDEQKELAWQGGAEAESKKWFAFFGEPVPQHLRGLRDKVGATWNVEWGKLTDAIKAYLEAPESDRTDAGIQNQLNAIRKHTETVRRDVAGAREEYQVNQDIDRWTKTVTDELDAQLRLFGSSPPTYLKGISDEYAEARRKWHIEFTQLCEAYKRHAIIAASHGEDSPVTTHTSIDARRGAHARIQQLIQFMREYTAEMRIAVTRLRDKHSRPAVIIHSLREGVEHVINSFISGGGT